MRLLKAQDHEKIRAAVEAAEARTSGEIVCVLAQECSDYWEVPLAWAGGVSMLGPAAALLLGFRPDLIDRLGGGWTAAHASSVDAAVSQALIAYVIAQAALFVAVALIASIPPIRRLLTPASLKRERVRRRAQEQFAARAMHLTEGKTGVLIFASLAERRAEVIAEEGISEKVDPAQWSEVLAALVAGMKARDPGSGFAAAIGKAGDLLAKHAPRRPDDRNELPDTVIELGR